MREKEKERIIFKVQKNNYGFENSGESRNLLKASADQFLDLAKFS